MSDTPFRDTKSLKPSEIVGNKLVESSVLLFPGGSIGLLTMGGGICPYYRLFIHPHALPLMSYAELCFPWSTVLKGWYPHNYKHWTACAYGWAL